MDRLGGGFNSSSDSLSSEYRCLCAAVRFNYAMRNLHFRLVLSDCKFTSGRQRGITMFRKVTIALIATGALSTAALAPTFASAWENGGWHRDRGAGYRGADYRRESYRWDGYRREGYRREGVWRLGDGRGGHWMGHG